MEFFDQFGTMIQGLDESRMNYLMQFGLAIVGILLVVALVTTVVGILMYVFYSLGLQTIAQRRGIHNPWLAWIPVANLWVLGCVSDQYQYVAKGNVRNRRKILLGLVIAQTAVALVFNILNNAMVMSLHGSQSASQILATVNLISNGCTGVLSVVLAVFRCIALYDLYSSCCPENNVLFLVLGIVFPVTVPFFVYCNRKKDLGMPPRVQQPVYEAPQQSQNFEEL